MKKRVLITLIALTFLVSTFGVVSTQALGSTSNPTPKIQKIADQRIDALKAKISQEIDRRITSLDKLIERINEIKKLSDASKSSLVTQAQDQITNLTSLKTKISADSDLATLKADRQAVYNQYWIYMLFIPKIYIVASADRLLGITDDTQTIADKLEPKVQGNASLEKTFADLEAKISDAKTQAQNAQNTVMPLTPDQGDKIKMEANKNALQNARKMLQTARHDLADARQDIQQIRQGLKVKTSPTPNPTPTP
jgi:hypothetical protein